MISSANKTALAIVLATSVIGCKVGPDYSRPQVQTPQNFRDDPATTQPTTQPAPTLAQLPWAQVFGQSQLQDLINEGIGANNDLRIAVSRIEQARAVEVQVRSELFPQVGYGGSAGTGQNYSLNNPSFTSGANHGSALAAVNATWELDLWGRIRRSNEAAHANFLATEEARNGVMLTLVSDIAQAYYELVGLDEQVVVAQRNVKSFQDSLRLFEQRAAGGIESKLEVSRAQAALSQVAATIPQLQILIAAAENRLNILLGRVPGPIARGSINDIAPGGALVPAGLPSSLLERRPDIRQAEQLMIAANARIGAAQADWFPRVGLTALFGRVSPELEEFNRGQWTSYGIGANITGPIFDADRIKGHVEQTKAQLEEARLQYQQATLIAFREVANALKSREKLNEELAHRRQAVDALVTAVEVSSQRYTVGRSSYYEVIEAQQQLYPAERDMTQVRTNQLVALVQLYRSLGGGWSAPTSTASSTTAPTVTQAQK